MSEPVQDYWVEIPSEPRKHRYKLRGGPIDNPEQAPEVFAALGRAFSAWARMEQHVDAILMQVNKVNHSTPELDLFDEKHPAPFVDKIDRLKEYFNKHPALEQYRDHVVDIANGLLELADERNSYAHGNFESFDAETQYVTINSVRYQRKTNDYLCRKRELPLALILNTARLANIANAMLADVSTKLFTIEGAASLRMRE